MKQNGYTNVRRMGVTLIALMMVFSASAMVMADSEPNDDFSQANNFWSDDMVFGNLDSSEDPYDYYEIYLSRNEVITITVSPMDDSLNLAVNLYDYAETMVSTASELFGIYSINYNVARTGTYYVRIAALSGSGDYYLTNSVSSDYTPPVGDQFDKATPASVPWTAGDYAASGGYIDMGKLIDEMKEEMTQDMPDDVKVSISGSGGAGQYMIVEYAGLDGANYKFDYSCRLYAALEASGKMTANEANVGGGETIDGKASGKVSIEADLLYEGSIWLAYYENAAQTKAYWAAEKMTLNLEGSLDLSASVDMDMSAQGLNIESSVDASATADMDMTLTFEAEPGIPYMPAKDVDMDVSKTCTVSYSGNVEFNMEMDMTATGYLNNMIGDDIEMPEPVHYKGAVNGSFEDYFSLGYVQSTKKATGPALLNGGWFMMMQVDEIGLSDFGTRASGFETVATYDPIKGIYTTFEPFMGPAGDMMGGIADTGSMDMTLTPIAKEDAQAFIDNPVSFLKDEGVSMPGSSSMLLILLIIVIVIVVVVVVVVMIVSKKKTPPQHPQPYMGTPQQPMYGPQPGYEQPPPQYPPPQQPDQYGNYPPPPPPPGQ